MFRSISLVFAVLCAIAMLVFLNKGSNIEYSDFTIRCNSVLAAAHANTGDTYTVTFGDGFGPGDGGYRQLIEERADAGGAPGDVQGDIDIACADRRTRSAAFAGISAALGAASFAASAAGFVFSALSSDDHSRTRTPPKRRGQQK